MHIVYWRRNINMDKGKFIGEVTEDFIKDLVSIMMAGTKIGANKMRFTLPKSPEMELDGDIEVTISWRLKE